jgi:hypothetical protein
MKLLLLLCILSTSSFCFGQRTITGTVSDVGGGLFDAIVLVKGTVINSSTDFDGNYAIAAKTGDVLVFSYPGYDTQEIKIVDQYLISILLESSMSCDLPTLNTFNVLHGINYETIGIAYKNYLKLLPWETSLDISYVTNFDHNSALQLDIGKEIRIDRNFDLQVMGQFETSDFNNSQYHSYILNVSKSIHVFSKNNYEEIQMITGYINYNGLNRSNNFGYGLGLERAIAYNFKVGTSFVHWQEFNEFNANASYTWRRWSLSGNYKHLADYEEFQVSLGYNFYF